MIRGTPFSNSINDFFPFKIRALCQLQGMPKSSRKAKKHQRVQTRGCDALCCSCRLSISSSSEEAQSSSSSDRFPAISSLTHAMVQERLDQMIRERQEAARREEVMRRRCARDNQGSSSSSSNSKFIVMVAMEKCSCDPREDFRQSMEQMIMANKIYDPKDLRRLLNCYVSMNSEESRGVILEVFHEVCTALFLSCKYHGS